MNLFYLDEDLDKCAEFHVDKHVNKMILEAAQLINTNLWIDHLFGFVPRAITKEENTILQATRKQQKELPMEDRIFPYLPTMQNHPSCVWVRSSLVIGRGTKPNRWSIQRFVLISCAASSIILLTCLST